MASYETKGQQVTYEASADLSTKMYHAMNLDTSGKLTAAGAGAGNIGEGIIGILQNKPAAAGRAGTVMIDGISKAVAGAPVPLLADRTPVKTNSAGRFIPATIGTDVIVGYAVTSASADGALFSIQFNAV